MTAEHITPLKATISKKSSVFIQPVTEDITFDQRIYAINWFDTRQLWLYNFYNLLASKSVLKVKGIPFFKGLTQEVLHGDKELRRDVVLIVSYPTLHAFKGMLENLYFQLVSVLRMAAVKSFGFGFFVPQEKLAVPEKDEDSAYAFHHFSVNENDQQDIIGQLKEIISKDAENASVIFDGGIGANLYSGDQTPTGKIPCLMDAAIVIKAQSDDVIKQLVTQDDYQTVIEQTKTSFIGLMKRVI